MKIYIAVLFSLLLTIVQAQASNLPHGNWSFKARIFQQEVKYILNFENASLIILRGNRKTEGPKLKIDQNQISADFGFGEGTYVLQKKAKDWLLCDSKKVNDCEKLRPEANH
jgi:hypothetical protein